MPTMSREVDQNKASSNSLPHASPGTVVTAGTAATAGCQPAIKQPASGKSGRP
jgi:hypothetical protein